MATEIVRWCDLHLEKDARVGAEPHALEVDGQRYEFDLCNECFKEATEPLQAVLSLARRDGEKPVRMAGGSRKSMDRRCAICSEVVSGSDARFNNHLRDEHSTTATQMFGLECPVCEYTAKNLPGLGTHGYHVHHSASVPALFDMARKEGDPRGVMRNRGLV